MYRSRWNRWNCSKVADIIRGTKKPFALGWREWDAWHEDAKKKHPLRYYLAENGLKTLQDILYFPYDVYHNVEVYVRNRWIDKTHIIKTGLKPGQYYEFDTKILHGLFNELVDYVETEISHTMKAYKDRNYKFKNGRCKQAGLDHLDWAIGLTFGSDYGINEDDPDYNKPTPQALSAMVIKELYLWWTETRPNRPDPHSLYDDAKIEESYDKIDKLETKYHQEDTDMMIKLITIRQDIWC
jgi:hypothetical protein